MHTSQPILVRNSIAQRAQRSVHHVITRGENETVCCALIRMLGADMLQMMQPAAQCHAGQGETGELQQQPQRLQSQQATLFPPSYFKEAATSPQTEAVPVGDEHTGKAASAPVLKPRDDGRPLNQREAVEGREEQTHLATLRLQNQALRCRGHINKGWSSSFTLYTCI